MFQRTLVAGNNLIEKSMRLLIASCSLLLTICHAAYGSDGFMVVMAYKPVGKNYFNAVVLPDYFPTKNECIEYLLDEYATDDTYEIKKTSEKGFFVTELDGKGAAYRSWFCAHVIQSNNR